MKTTSTLSAGAAEMVIPSTPGLDLAGYVNRDNPSRQRHDEIFARALALEAGDQLWLLLSADVVGFEAATIAAIRARITEQLPAAGLSFRAVSITIAATHTHSAPASMPLRGCGEVNAQWLQSAIAVLAETALRAVRDLRPARLGFGSATVAGVAIDRRAKQSTLSPDPELGVLRVEAASGQAIACGLNFACHPVVLGGDSLAISSDYPSELARRLKEQLGAVTLFTNGACGDINPAWRGSWSEVERVAAPLIDAVERVWTATPMQENIELAALSQTLTLPLLPLPPHETLEAQSARFALEAENAARAGASAAARVASAYQDWAAQALQTEPHQLQSKIELQVVRVGAAILVAVPGEFFVALGLRIKQRLRAAGMASWVLGYANGNIGYLPTREAYQHGGYEIETAHRFYGWPSCVAPEAGEAVVETALSLAQKLETL